ncbi:hypothetical protein IscW_ISCW013660 [Ixodes scapularis]|uniref:Uncharacterized protein n=1 Tax=Ixodes scapularis TaxID=6945 RepID=B7QIH1_IXOSC|nr:hypothetical protein IscW_ISCW013660 [Ixodes scapularis]|eukprot:XP_002414978.1 hypothetical protein IscW_ISCW013660 [Ixodes scapularis]
METGPAGSQATSRKERAAWRRALLAEGGRAARDVVRGKGAGGEADQKSLDGCPGSVHGTRYAAYVASVRKRSARTCGSKDEEVGLR